jgi:3-oxoacyl-[acyl-carrier-protein] synthase-3
MLAWTIIIIPPRGTTYKEIASKGTTFTGTEIFIDPFYIFNKGCFKMSRLKEVELVSTGVYLPGEPVPFDKIEDVIGRFDKASPRMQKLIDKLRLNVKDLIGIDQCFFAIDPKTKELTEDNTSMAVKAIRNALEKANMEIDKIDCILLANPLPDQQTPPTTTFIQEELGIERCAEMEIHSNCTGITKVLQIAFDAIRVGRYKTVLVVYSQLSSAYLLSRHYNQQIIKTENVLLRWFLSDSASALILQAKENQDSGIRVLEVYNESVGGKLDPAMWFYHGARNFEYLKAYEKGSHHLGQNYNIVNLKGPDIIADGFKNLISRANIDKREINHVLATIPSTMLINKGKEAFASQISISPDIWFSNISKKGYSGGSSVVIGLDEMIDKNIFKRQEMLACITIESSKWMVGGFILKYL